MRDKYEVDYVDMITEAGPDQLLSSDNQTAIESIKNRVQISVELHGSKIVAIAAHEDCAGNSVLKAVHEIHVKESLAVIKSWKLPVEVIGLWVQLTGQVVRLY